MGAVSRPPLQSAQAAARPLCPPPGGRAALVRCAVRLSPELLPRRSVVRPARQRTRLPQGRGDGRVVQLGQRCAAQHAVVAHGDLRDARARRIDAARRSAAARARHLCGPGRSGLHRASAGAGCDGGGVVARARLPAGPLPGRARPAQLLGLQHAGVLRAGAGLPVDAHAARDEGGDPAAARGGHRGAARRGVQPHLRRQRAGADAVVPRAGQRELLPAGAGPGALLHQRHGLRQYAQPVASARAADGDGCAALLGQRLPHRRLPLRPGRDAGTRGARLRSRLGVLRCRAARPGARHRQDDRRAVGCRARRLPARQPSARLRRMERPLPRRRPALLARRRRAAPGAGRAAHGQRRPVRAALPAAVGLDQLCRFARRLHAARRGQLHPPAQRSQRRRQPRRPPRQLQRQLGRRRPDRRRRHPGPAGPGGARAAGHRPALQRHADAAGRRRIRPHAAGQQQRLLPGQRDLVAGLVDARAGRRAGAVRLHRAPDRAAQDQPRPALAALRARRGGGAARRAGHRLVRRARPPAHARRLERRRSPRAGAAPRLHRDHRRRGAAARGANADQRRRHRPDLHAARARHGLAARHRQRRARARGTAPCRTDRAGAGTQRGAAARHAARRDRADRLAARTRSRRPDGRPRARQAGRSRCRRAAPSRRNRARHRPGEALP